MDMDFELWILIPSLFHPGMVEYIKTAFKNAVFNFELVILWEFLAVYGKNKISTKEKYFPYHVLIVILFRSSTYAVDDSGFWWKAKLFPWSCIIPH